MSKYEAIYATEYSAAYKATTYNEYSWQEATSASIAAVVAAAKADGWKQGYEDAQ